MGSIVTQVKIINPLDKDKQIECSALVDTGAAYLTLPKAWKNKLGALDELQRVTAKLANQEDCDAEIAGPVRIEIGQFRPAYTEILFIDMGHEEEDYQPLLGHLPLQQCGVAVDMVSLKLISIPYIDCK